MFNDEPIVSPDYKITASGDNHTLHISDVFDEDAGRFSVVAENSSGVTSCSALLVVMDMSEISGDDASSLDASSVSGLISVNELQFLSDVEQQKSTRKTDDESHTNEFIFEGIIVF